VRTPSTIVSLADAIRAHQPVHRLPPLRCGEYCSALRVRLRAKLHNVRILRPFDQPGRGRGGPGQLVRDELGSGKPHPSGHWLLHGALAAPRVFKRVIHGGEHGFLRRDRDPAGLPAFPRGRG
jgi:hypothetical protein